MCFSRDNTVVLSTNQVIPISDLKMGDVVKSIDSNGAIINSEIVMFLHSNQFQKSIIFKYSTDSSCIQIK